MVTGALLLALVVLVTAAGAGEEKPAPGKPAVTSWERVTEKAAFRIRDTAEDLVFAGKMWMSNGYFGSNTELYHDLWTSTDGATWTLASDKTPYDGYSEMVVFKGKMWAIKASVWSSADGANWTKVAERTPFGSRGYGEVVVHDGKMWQLGSGEDVWYSADGANWTCAVEHAPFGKRYGSAVAAYRGKLWLMGGAVPAESDPPEKHYKAYTTYNDVWSSKDGAHWTREMEHAPWAERMWFVSKVYAGRMWIIGGFSNRESRNFPDAWSTKDGVHWEELASETHFSPRHEPAVYVYKGSLWVAGGNSWPLMNDVWKLTLPGAPR